MFNLQNLFDRVLIDSGQFILPQDKVELDVKKFKILVDMVIGIWNKYNPIYTHLYKDITTQRQYKFDTTNTPFVTWKGKPTTSVKGAPVWVTEIQPIRVSGVYPYWLRDYDRPKSNLDIKTEFPWEYRNPILTVPVSGEYDVFAVYHHTLVEVSTEQSTDYMIETVDDTDDHFLNLLKAKFLVGLGRSRRAFTIQDIPITTDASELVSEGKDLEKETMDLIKENASFFLAMR